MKYKELDKTILFKHPIVNNIRLLKYNEIKLLFPNATIYKEKFFGLTKSFIVLEINR
jgi:hypothetical protein